MRYNVSFRWGAKREELARVQGLLPESQGQNLALTVLTVLYVPYFLGIGYQETLLK